MKDSIFGEESNIFTNGIGESITVQIKENVSETAKLLTAVMGEYRNSSNRAMTILAEEIHRQLDDHDTEVIPQNIADGITTTYENLGVWIDPIGNNQYNYNYEQKRCYIALGIFQMLPMSISTDHKML